MLSSCKVFIVYNQALLIFWNDRRGCKFIQVPTAMRFVRKHISALNKTRAEMLSYLCTCRWSSPWRRCGRFRQRESAESSWIGYRSPAWEPPWTPTPSQCGPAAQEILSDPLRQLEKYHADQRRYRCNDVQQCYNLHILQVLYALNHFLFFSISNALCCPLCQTPSPSCWALVVLIFTVWITAR